MQKPHVTVYILSHNYAPYLPQAIESVINQFYRDWELLLIDDGSDDDSTRIMQRFCAAYPDKIRVFTHRPSRGLVKCANLALREAHGEYFIRLDADDFFDEGALLLMATYLDQHPGIGLVFPNFYYVNAAGDVLGIEYRRRIGKEVDLLNLPAHGAGTMIRKRCLKVIGGYNEGYDRQDGWDLWLRFTRHFEVANVTTPLFYYRQHGANLTRNEFDLLSTRRRIEHDLVENLQGDVGPRIAAIIMPSPSSSALKMVAGHPLIDYTIEQAHAVDAIDKIIFPSMDLQVLEYVRERFPYVQIVDDIPLEISGNAQLANAISYAVEVLESKHEYYPDIIILLNILTPLRSPDHIVSAIDTLRLHSVDSVISVYQDDGVHYLHGQNGLVPLNPSMYENVRTERETLLVDNKAVLATWRETLTLDQYIGQRIGHIIMPKSLSWAISDDFSAWLIEQILTDKRIRELSDVA